MAYRALGITDSVNVCDCCGKSNLKQTVAMESEAGELVHFGTTCATRHSGRDLPTIKREIEAEIEAKEKAAYAEFHRSEEAAAYDARIKEACKVGLIGVTFRDFCRAQYEAAQTKREAIAAKFGIKSYAF